MLENEENVNEDETPAADEAPDQVAEEVVAPEEPADEPTADEVAAEEPAAEEAAAEEPAAEEAPAEEPAAEEAAVEEAAAEETPVEEPPVEEPPADEPPVEEPPAEDAPAPAAAAPAEEAEPVEQLSPKERRRQGRSAHTGEARPQRTIEERAAERAETRRTKAKNRRAYRLKQRERRAGQPRAEAAPATESASEPNIKVRQGVVVSDKADKTIIVRVDTARAHRMYKKVVRTSATLHAHDENNDAHIGDMVRVVESRPLSRTKRWRLVEVLERAR
jgi:small subunit ribosomal protein S17